MDTKNYKIYLHTNLINGKKYVGQTYTSLEKRFGKNGRNYKKSGLDESDPRQNIFFKAILKYGWENFNHTLLEENLNEEEANEREKYYIKLYHTWIEDSKCWGYNSTPGGRENPQMTENIKNKISNTIQNMWDYDEEYREKTIKVIKNRTYSKEDRERMRNKLLKQKEDESFNQKARERASEWSTKAWAENGVFRIKYNENGAFRSRSVICLNTGEIFSTLAEAGKKYNIDASGLTKVLNGDKKTFGKHPVTNIPLYWEEYMPGKKYNIIGIENPNIIEEPYYSYSEIKRKINISKPIECEENKIVFISCTDTGKRTNIDKASINRCCLGKQKIAGGYHWKYISKKEFLQRCKSEKEITELLTLIKKE